MVHIETFSQLLFVLVNSKPVIDGVKHDKLSGPSLTTVMITGNKGVCTTSQSRLMSVLFLHDLPLERCAPRGNVGTIYVLFL